MFIRVKTLKTLQIYAVMLRLLSDIFPKLILYSWRTFRLLSPVLSGWISIMTVKAYWCHLFQEIYCSCSTCRSCMLTNEVFFSRCTPVEIPGRCYMLGYTTVLSLVYAEQSVQLTTHLFAYLCPPPTHTQTLGYRAWCLDMWWMAQTFIVIYIQRTNLTHKKKVTFWVKLVHLICIKLH